MLQAISPLVKSAVACLFLVTLATMPPLSRFYFAELCSHYRVQMAVVGLLFCLLLWREPQPMLAKYRRLRWRSFAFIPVIIHVMFIVGWYLPGQPLFSAGSGMQPMRLLISNVHTSNTKYEELIALIEREQPDVVTLCEINQNWATALEAVHEQFPYRVVIPRSDNFGIAILSRHYIIRNDVFSLGDAQPPAIEVSIWSDDHRELTIVAAHTYPPVGYQLSEPPQPAIQDSWRACFTNRRISPTRG